MLFWKQSIGTFECYFERHTFDYKQRETCFKIVDSWSIISEFINDNKSEKAVFFFLIFEKKQKKI